MNVSINAKNIGQLNTGKELHVVNQLVQTHATEKGPEADDSVQVTRVEGAASRPAVVQVHGSQYRQLVEALVDAFPVVAAFDKMLEFRLGKKLAQYAALPGRIDDVVFEVIRNCNAET